MEVEKLQAQEVLIGILNVAPEVIVLQRDLLSTYLQIVLYLGIQIPKHGTQQEAF